MHVAVIIVSFNTCDLLQRCLRSVIATTRLPSGPLSAEIIVVDNGSQDGSPAMVRNEFPDVTLLAQDDNLGFTGANNLALDRLGLVSRGQESARREPEPDFVLLLNSDAELTNGAVQRMVEVLEEHPDAAVCGAHLSYGDGTFQHGAFRFPSLFQVALDLFPLSDLPGAHRLHDSRLNGRYPLRLWQGTMPFVADFVLGAAMLVRSTAIRGVGVLDDRYFMYCEEMDWCLRMAQAGWSVYVAPTARVVHHSGQSSRQVRWQAFVRMWRSRFLFYAKYADRYGAVHMHLLRALIALSVRYRGHCARRRFARGELTGTELAAELDAYRSLASL